MLFERFIEELHQLWVDSDGEHLQLKVLGSTALFLQTPYQRGTKDSDVIETEQMGAEVKARLLAFAGKGSALHRRHQMYLDLVSPNIPMLPPEPLWHHYPLRLERFDLLFLDVADVLVSKLKRFSSSDRDDVRAMIEGEHVQHRRIVRRFQEVIERYRFDGRAARLPEMAARLNMAERDWFGVEETEFEDLEDLIY